MSDESTADTPDFTATAAEFGQAEWQELNKAFLGPEAPRPCPACKRTGCYGSYRAGTVCYRMCKFCGFYQLVGKDSIYLVPNAHSCEHADACRILGELYIQWAKADEVTRKCYFCKHKYSISSYTVPRPWATPEHGWWEIPQGMSRDDSIEFWRAQGKDAPYL